MSYQVKMGHTSVRLPIPVLVRLVLKFIYDRDHTTAQERNDMQSSLENWARYVNEKKDEIIKKYGLTAHYSVPMGLKGCPIDELELHVQRMAWLLVEDEKGKWDKRKKMFKEKGIDYKKFFRLPEAYTAEDFARALEILKKWNAEHADEVYG